MYAQAIFNIVLIFVIDLFVMEYKWTCNCIYHYLREKRDMMLRLEHVNKRISSFELKDIHFHLPKGYICGLIGENGAGKTSLIKTIIGLYSMDSGVCKVNELDFATQEADIKEQFGLILDICMFEKYLSLELVGKYYGPFYQSYDHKLFMQYLKQFELNPKKKVKTLSKGMLIKLQLAFALSHDAKLFIFDEPTSGMDEEFRKEFYQICAELVSDGEHSVLVSTHITEDLDRIADYLAYIQDGELLFFDEKDHVLDKFVIVIAENYKLKLLSKDYVIHTEESTYGGTAMMLKRRHIKLDDAYSLKRPNIQELMYYIVKGGHNHAKNVIAKCFN